MKKIDLKYSIIPQISYFCNSWNKIQQNNKLIIIIITHCKKCKNKNKWMILIFLFYQNDICIFLVSMKDMFIYINQYIMQFSYIYKV